jgi:hypothetical protein
MMINKPILNQQRRFVITTISILILFLSLSSCASLRRKTSTSTTDSIPYPIVIKAEESRQNQALADWEAMTKEQGIINAPAPNLDPITATIQSIPQMSTYLYLPKVGVEVKMTEEETLEALRRFITTRRRLIGADPQQFSLVLKEEQANTTKVRYQQKPLPYPLRGGYGLLEIEFTEDRRILKLSSTAIPETELLRRAIADLRPQLKPEEIATYIDNRSFTYTNTNGTEQTFSFGQKEGWKLQELVIYPLVRLKDPAVLEFHLAWELIKDSSISQKVYLDAITNVILFPPKAETNQISAR